VVAVTDQTKADERNQGYRDMQANVAALAEKKLEKEKEAREEANVAALGKRQLEMENKARKEADVTALAEKKLEKEKEAREEANVAALGKRRLEIENEAREEAAALAMKRLEKADETREEANVVALSSKKSRFFLHLLLPLALVAACGVIFALAMVFVADGPSLLLRTNGMSVHVSSQGISYLGAGLSEMSSMKWENCLNLTSGSAAITKRSSAASSELLWPVIGGDVGGGCDFSAPEKMSHASRASDDAALGDSPIRGGAMIGPGRFAVMGRFVLHQQGYSVLALVVALTAVAVLVAFCWKCQFKRAKAKKDAQERKAPKVGSDSPLWALALPLLVIALVAWFVRCGLLAVATEPAAAMSGNMPNDSSADVVSDITRRWCTMVAVFEEGRMKPWRVFTCVMSTLQAPVLLIFIWWAWKAAKLWADKKGPQLKTPRGGYRDKSPKQAIAGTVQRQRTRKTVEERQAERTDKKGR